MKTVAIEWLHGPGQGEIRVDHGTPVSVAVVRGEGTARGASFSLADSGRLEVAIDGENVGHGAYPTMVTVATQGPTFTFLLRDVHADYPIWIPAYGVVVTEPADPRSCAEIAEEIRAGGGQTALQRIASEPEESYERSAAVTRSLPGPTWLGLSRDMRTFQIEVRTRHAGLYANGPLPRGWPHAGRSGELPGRLQVPLRARARMHPRAYRAPPGGGCASHSSRSTRRPGGEVPLHHLRYPGAFPPHRGDAARHAPPRRRRLWLRMYVHPGAAHPVRCPSTAGIGA